MRENVYSDLARRLDAIPNGFPATESGIELELLAKLFTPAEAALAAKLRLSQEPAATIADRAGVAPEVAYGTLKRMARRGLIRVKRGRGELLFGLMPFVVGFYEEQLGRIDEELAAIIERYLQETGGAGMVQGPPAVHRVIPVEESIPFELQIFPYERATQLLEGAKSWGVRDCICRIQQQLIGRGCDHEQENCIVFAPVEGAFDHSEVNRAITKQDALRILREAGEAGLIHSTGNYQDPHYYICNCCPCCCGILRGVVEFGVPTAVARADFRAAVDADSCVGCGDCLERCAFAALTLAVDQCEVDWARCVGCGLCVTTCPTGALQMERGATGEVPPPPRDIKEWGRLRAAQRGITLDEVM